jgi:hypothetical protein
MQTPIKILFKDFSLRLHLLGIALGSLHAQNGNKRFLRHVLLFQRSSPLRADVLLCIPKGRGTDLNVLIAG